MGVFEFGGPEMLQVVELPTPIPGPGEVRIRVHAAAVNPTDTLFRQGAQHHPGSRRPPPYIPGMDAAGVIDGVGPDVADRLQIGDRVVALVVPRGRLGGAYAEQILVPAESVVPAPFTDLVASATLLMNAMTARLALDALQVGPGDVIAVTGAAGAFGGYAVQLAKSDGLRVIADTAPADEDLVASLGADVVVARGDGVADRIRAVAPQGVAGVADGALLHELALPAIRDGGRLATVRGWAGPASRGIEVRPVMVSQVAGDTAALQRLSEQAARSVLTLRVADVLPAVEAAQAHRRVEAGGVRGRLVLRFGPDDISG